LGHTGVKNVRTRTDEEQNNKLSLQDQNSESRPETRNKVIIKIEGIGYTYLETTSTLCKEKKTMRASHHSPIATLLLLLLRWFATTLANIPELPFGDINVVVVTDVHSFIGGHPHEPNRNANYGHVLSFYERLKEWCDENDRDLWFVMNGDFVHGTGLAMDGNASALVPLLNHMPWDAVTIGNHEAYHNAVVELMQDSFIPNFQGKYLTSNVLKSDTKEPFGSRYRLLVGKKHTVLVFGFLYNLHNPSELLEVTHVENAVQEEWFNYTLQTEEYDAILVLAHMDVVDPLVRVIRDAIRHNIGSEMPIQFLTGHTHIRAEAKVDWLSHSFEAGANLDTVGFVSFPTQAHFQLDKQDAKASFQYQFINASVPALSKALNLGGGGAAEQQPSLQTENGTALAQLIHDTQDALGLREVVGCPGRDYFRNVSIHHTNSIWKLWQDHVVKTQIFAPNNPKSVMMVTSDSWRYDLRGSGTGDAMTVDDVVAIAPFMEPVVYVGKVAEWIVRRMNNSLNTDSHHALVPDYVLAGDVEASGDYDFYTHEYNLPEIVAELTRLHAENLKPKRMGTRDTLYWLNYLEQACPCKDQKGQVKDVDPWFQNKDELEEEATDGHRTSESWDDIESEDGEAEVEEEGNNQEEQPKVPKEEAKYYGYVAPAVADQYELSPAIAPSNVNAVNYPAPTLSKNKSPPPHRHHSTPQEKKAKVAKRKKIRRTIFKVIALLLAATLLIAPLVCLYMNVWGGKEKPDSDDILYDQEEVAALRGGGKKGKRNNRSRPPPSEIEIT
jgi:2',3'-cyclic-nucleotide 2'-phosphodiesterase (5'-nucleotidase family)